MTSPANTVSPVTYQNIGVQSGFLLIQANAGQVNVYNGDLTNVLLLSRSPTPNLSNSIPVQPLTNVTLNGKMGYYASAQSGSVALVSVSAAGQLSPSPAQIAAQIGALGLATEVTLLSQTNGGTIAGEVSNTGVPLLTSKNDVQDGTITVPAATPTKLPTSGFFNITQIAYEMIFQAMTSAATATPINVDLTWLDSTSGLVVADDNFWFYAGTNAAPHLVHGKGPSKANELDITITSPNNAVTINYSIMEMSRVYANDLWKTVTPNGQQPVIPGFTFVTNDSSGGYLAAVQQSIAAGSSVAFLLPLYTGLVFFEARTDDGTVGNGEWRLTAQPETATFAPIQPIYFLIFSGQTGFALRGNGSAVIDIPLPRAQSLLTCLNINASAAHTHNVNLLVKEYVVT
jgi:hypothetical protein